MLLFLLSGNNNYLLTFIGCFKMKISTQKIDLNAAEDGVLFPFDEETGAAVRIAMWDNKAHSACIRELFKKHGKAIELGIMKEEQSSYLLAEQWPHIIKDMIKFTDDDDQPFVYSPQAVVNLARNPQYEKFFAKIRLIAQDERNFRSEMVKLLGENLPDSFNGQ